LAGERIPLEARIVKVADAFDAMLSDRPYRKALSLDEALDQLRGGSGSEFDPSAVEAFIALVKRGEIRVPTPDGQQVP
jgi:HD-GYP domain-containing protein (c-di-GMP phosphodiesterase class II)